MEKLRCGTPLSVLLSQVSFLLLITGPYAAPDKYFINCGSGSNATLGDDRVFVGDLNPGPFGFSPGRSEAVQDANPPANSSLLYRTARVYKSPSSYELATPEGRSTTYLLRLHFFPSSGLDLAGALFNVSASRYSLLSGFRVPNGSQTPVIKEFILTVKETKLEIRFTPLESSLAFVNAIEVLSASNQLLPPDNATHVTAAGINPNYTGPLPEALQTLYRLNVGGPAAENDSLWRRWIPDDGFLIDRSRAMNTSFSAELYRTLDAAPEFVYQTAKSNNISASVFPNITWKLNVSKNAAHLVRFHFCDNINPFVSAKHLFDLYIYGKFSNDVNTYPEFNQLQTPFYFDFIVDSDDSGFMNLSVGTVAKHPNTTAFLNGLEIMKLCVPMQGLKRKKHVSFVAIIGPIVGAGALICLVLTVFLQRLGGRGKAEKEPTGGDYLYGGESEEQEIDADTFEDSGLNLNLKISLDEIRRATKNFDEEMRIGEGGFGDVYKGILDNGDLVAVKRHKRGKQQGGAEFKREIRIFYKIRHRHLVHLKGYCNDMSEMILVYEFMENGSLKSHLYDADENPACTLTWEDRLKICIGAATGLNYLHTNSEPKIIHRDVKPENILLDRDFTARVADFGISKMGPVDQNSVSVAAKGTYGYMDHEYLTTRKLTTKFDVYSFGVVLLEVLCARPAVKDQNHLSQRVKQAGRRYEEIIDPFLVGKVSSESLEKFLETALRCMEKHSENRPTMSEVQSDLEGLLKLEKGSEEMEAQPRKGGTGDAATAAPLRASKQSPLTEFALGEEPAHSGTTVCSDTTAGEVFSELMIEIPR